MVYNWYLCYFGIMLNKLNHVFPLFQALQGHPEASILWEYMITDIVEIPFVMTIGRQKIIPKTSVIEMRLSGKRRDMHRITDAMIIDTMVIIDYFSFHCILGHAWEQIYDGFFVA